jgi:hypothetical protein
LVEYSQQRDSLSHQLAFARFQSILKPKPDTKDFLDDNLPLKIRSFFELTPLSQQGSYLKTCFVLCHFSATLSPEMQVSLSHRLVALLNQKNPNASCQEITTEANRFIQKTHHLLKAPLRGELDLMTNGTVEYMQRLFFTEKFLDPAQWLCIYAQNYQSALQNQEQPSQKVVEALTQAALQAIPLSPQSHYQALSCLLLHYLSLTPIMPDPERWNNLIRRWVGYAKKLSYLPGRLIGFEAKDFPPQLTVTEPEKFRAALILFLEHNGAFIRHYNPDSLAHRLIKVLTHVCRSLFSESLLTNSETISYLQTSLNNLYQSLRIPPVRVEGKMMIWDPLNPDISAARLAQPAPAVRFSRERYFNLDSTPEHGLLHRVLEDATVRRFSKTAPF